MDTWRIVARCVFKRTSEHCRQDTLNIVTRASAIITVLPGCQMGRDEDELVAQGLLADGPVFGSAGGAFAWAALLMSWPYADGVALTLAMRDSGIGA